MPRLSTPSSVVQRAYFAARLTQLRLHATKTSAAHDKVRREFLDYLVSDGAEKQLHVATPLDVMQFLLWKDTNGKTRVHIVSCPFWKLSGALAGDVCNCPRRAAASSANTAYGYLRAMFNEAGFTSPWNPATCMGNPTISPQIDMFLQLVSREQLAGGVETRRAPLLGPCIFRFIIDGFLRASLRWLQARNHAKSFLAVRDALFLSILWFSGLRASDALRILCQQIEPVTTDDGTAGWALHVAVTKSARDVRSRRNLSIMDDGTRYSPIRLHAAYAKAAERLGIFQSTGTLFRNVQAAGNGRYRLGTDATWGVMARRFKEMVHQLAISGAITLHSPHGSFPRHLRDGGLPHDVICTRLDWTPVTFEYYTSLSRSVLLLPEALSLFRSRTARVVVDERDGLDAE